MQAISGAGRISINTLLLLASSLSRPPRLLRFADAPACLRTHGSLASAWPGLILNARILNLVLTPCGCTAAPTQELSLYRCQAVDFGLEAGEGVGGDIVLSASSWHNRRAYQHSLRFESRWAMLRSQICRCHGGEPVEGNAVLAV